MRRFITRHLLVVVCSAWLIGCAGGNHSAGTTGAADVATSFPGGLAIGSPTDVSGSATALLKRHDGLRFAQDWGRAVWRALNNGDRRQLAQLAAAVLPLGSAQAAGVSTPDISRIADLINKVLSGDSSVDLSAVLAVQQLFDGGGSNADCFGPTLQYANHDDYVAGPGQSGQLPSGDLGLWKDSAGSGAPCIAEQLNFRVRGVRRQTLQGLLLMAAMRHAVAGDATLAMPAAGASTDLTTAFTAVLADVAPSMTVESATIALDSGDTAYTYRLVLNNGDTGLNYRRGEVIMRHTPGADAQHYTGLMQVSGFTETNDSAMGCDDEMDGSLYKAASVSTLSYSRQDDTIAFSSRYGQYCGHPTDDSAADYGAQVASFSSGQLDPTVSVPSGFGGRNHGTTLGWIGGFARFAGSFDRTTLDGSFQYAWQAGPSDGNSRTLLATSSYDSALGSRTVTGYFGYAGDIAATDGTLLGMICNWAGPGNSHTPANLFQMQTASIADSAASFTLDASKIRYAPTVSCNSSAGMTYDVDTNGSIDAGEGSSVTHDLDGLTGAHTSVQEEIAARGFTTPAGF